MERDINEKRAAETGNTKAEPGYEQNGRHYSEENEVKPGEGMLHHGRPLSDMEIEELRIHKENNRFLGIADTPEAGTGSGNAGGVIPDASDLQNSADKLQDHSDLDSNFGRNYMGGMQSQDHFITNNSHHEDIEEEKK